MRPYWLITLGCGHYKHNIRYINSCMFNVNNLQLLNYKYCRHNEYVELSVISTEIKITVKVMFMLMKLVIVVS